MTNEEIDNLKKDNKLVIVEIEINGKKYKFGYNYLELLNGYIIGISDIPIIFY